MIDRDGIERPDNPHAHEFSMKQNKNKIKITKKTYIPTNPFYICLQYLLHCVAWLILPIICKLWLGVRVYGKENLKKIKGKPAIVVSNHVNKLDFPSFAACAYPNRFVRFITLQSNLQIPFIGKIVQTLGGLPIPENIKDTRCFVYSLDELVNKNKVIHIMPEGSLWRYYRDLRPFIPGSFKIAAKKDIATVPVLFSFRMKTKTKRNGKIKRKYKMDITVLEPVYADNSLERNERVKELSDRVWNIMNTKLTEINQENDKKQ